MLTESRSPGAGCRGPWTLGACDVTPSSRVSRLQAAGAPRGGRCLVVASASFHPLVILGPETMHLIRMVQPSAFENSQPTGQSPLLLPKPSISPIFVFSSSFPPPPVSSSFSSPSSKARSLSVLLLHLVCTASDNKQNTHNRTHASSFRVILIHSLVHVHLHMTTCTHRTHNFRLTEAITYTLPHKCPTPTESTSPCFRLTRQTALL